MSEYGLVTAPAAAALTSTRSSNSNADAANAHNEYSGDGMTIYSPSPSPVYAYTGAAAMMKKKEEEDSALQFALDDALHRGMGAFAGEAASPSAQRGGGAALLSLSNKADQKKLSKLLEEHAKTKQEFADKVKSLELQNSQLSDKLRSRSAEKEHEDRLHALQILERGVVLKELAKQVTDLKARLALERRNNKQAGNSRSKSPASQGAIGTLPPPDVNARKVAIESLIRAKTPVMMARGAVLDENLTKAAAEAIATANKVNISAIGDPEGAAGTLSFSRMLAASASMPILSADYGSFKTNAGVNTRADSRDSADTNFQTNGRITSPYLSSRGKNVSRGKVNFFPDLVPNEDRVDKDLQALQEFGGYNHPSKNSHGQASGTADTSASANASASVKEQLQGVRQQIVSILSERYPPPSSEQLLAVKKAKERAEAKREMELKEVAMKKEAEAAKHAAIRARAKPKVVRDDDDW
jgi:hypothetical protein